MPNTGSVEAGGGIINGEAADPLRYDNHNADPAESTGLIISLIPRGARVLDVGCGTGSVSCLVRDHCHAEVVGIEPSLERAEVAKHRGLTVYHSFFPCNEVPANGNFDVVLFADVLEHMVEPGLVLLGASAFLRPGGSIVVSIPNVAHWSVRWNLLWGRFDYRPSGIMDATHLRWFTYKSVRLLMAAAGYEINAHKMSTNYELEDYRGVPWRWLGVRTRNRIIRLLVRVWPKLFGCQHVIKASKITGAA
ncbi:class I SAM-dependent methyltransferase [Limnoglobus roseus]